jgi:adenine-specific DNA-methyltransferase
MPDRTADFERIRSALGQSIADETGSSLLCHGDSLSMLSKLPDGSVSLILTDPPYHSTKKENISGDRAFEEDANFLEWMESYAQQWKRILRISGTLYVFCSSQMSARLEVMLAKYFRPMNNITWTKPNDPGYDGWKGKMKKEALRQWYPHSERILALEHGAYGSPEAYRRSPLGEYLMQCRLKAGISGHTLTGIIGAYGKVNHGGAVANWEAGRYVPSREQYLRITEALEATGKIDPMLAYEDIVRPLNVNGNIEFTDVWNFMSVRQFKGKHPAEKPQDMLMHMISASSYPGDIVLDNFAGSGSTGVAAIRLGRKAICMEIDEVWVKRSAKELQNASLDDTYTPLPRQHNTAKTDLAADSLFD